MTDPFGNVWFGPTECWDGARYHRYEPGERTTRDPKTVTPHIMVSPRGNVWMRHAEGHWLRFAPKTRTFSPESPHEDFAFKVGGRIIAVLGNPGEDPYLNCGMGHVYVKQDGQWRQLENPFSGKDWVARRGNAMDCTFLAIPGRCVHGSRLLLSCHLGTFEWDARTDSWAYLAPFSNSLAVYDLQGRRVIFSREFGDWVLVYEGKSFDADVSSEQGRDNGESALQGLLTRLDDDDPDTRERATTALADMLRKNSRTEQRLLAALDKGSLSEEVVARIRLVLDTGTAALQSCSEFLGLEWRRRTGNSLFERMSRPLVPTLDGGLVIRQGMPRQAALSILQTCGEMYANRVHSDQYPNETCWAYAQRDNTMVYLRLNSEQVSSLGIGPRGTGYDRRWDWKDAAKNGVKQLELQPRVDTIGK